MSKDIYITHDGIFITICGAENAPKNSYLYTGYDYGHLWNSAGFTEVRKIQEPLKS